MSSTTEPSSRPPLLQLLAGASLVSWNRALLRLGLRRPVNGWRRGAGLVLRGDAAKFVLSAFALDVLSDEQPRLSQTIEQVQQHFTDRLAKFLLAESEFHCLIRHETDHDRVVAHSGPGYTLAFEPWVHGPARFIRPDDWKGEHASPPVAGTSPVLEFVCRINSEQLADLWVRVNHVGADGVPVQDMLSRLEKAWGVAGPIIVPAREEFDPHTTPRHSPGRPGTAEVQTFIEFDRLLAWRKRENEKLPEPMTFSAAMMWWLARHDMFSQLHLGTTVELPAVDGIGSGVSMVVIRPADYFHRPNGLARYVNDFNRELNLTRQRKSNGCKTLDAAAFLPPKLEEKLLHHALRQGGRAFGSVGLTVLKDAKVFGAPLADAGHDNGFIAVGSVSLQSADGKRVGCVVVKGPCEKIANHAAILQVAIEQAAYA